MKNIIFIIIILSVICGYISAENEEPRGKPRGIFVGEEIYYTGGGSYPNYNSLTNMSNVVNIPPQAAGYEPPPSNQTTSENDKYFIQHEKDQPSVHYIKDGEYAFYLDKRYNTVFYRGYMKFTSADNQIGIIVRNINAKTNEERNFIFVIDDDENGYPTKVKGIQGQFNGIEIRQALADFQNFAALYITTQNKYEKQSIIDDDWENFTLIFSFDKTLPFFKFSDVKLKGKDESLYELLYGGKLDNISLGAFFQMKPVRE